MAVKLLTGTALECCVVIPCVLRVFLNVKRT